MNLRLSRQRLAVDAAAFLVVFVKISFLVASLSDGDTWWHLGAGRWIVENQVVPSTDPFSFSSAGHAWHAHEWGAEVLMWAAYSAGGLSGLIAMVAGAAGLGSALLCHIMQRHVPAVVAISVAAAAALCLMTSAWIRPHLLALPLLVLWGGMLFSRTDDRPPPLMLVLVMILWANLHASFLLGLMLIGPAGLEALTGSTDRIATLRRWTIFAVVSAAAALITPYGLNGFLYPLQVSSMTTLRYIAEWNPSSMHNAWVFLLTLLATIALFLWLGVRLTIVRAALYAMLLYLAFKHVRHQFVFAYVGWIVAAGGLGAAIAGSRLSRLAFFRMDGRDDEPADRWMCIALVVTCLAAIGARLAIPVAIGDRHFLPTALIERLPANLRQAPVFNEYSFGGPLIFSGIRPFIDGRADMYGDAFVEDYVKAEAGDERVWRRVAIRHRFTWTILPSGSALIPVLERSGWRRLMSDDRAVVHVRPGFGGGVVSPAPAVTGRPRPPTPESTPRP